MHLNQIPADELVDRFNRIALSEFFAYTKGCPFWTIRGSGLRLYRAQRFPNSQYCNHTSRLSYPPAECVKTLGRANRENSPILYVAQDGRTAIFESRFQAGEHFTVAEFQLLEGEYLNLQHVGMFGAASNILRDLAGDIPRGLDKRLGLNPIGIANVKVIHQLLGNEFMRDVLPGHELEYARSVAIAEFLL